MDPITFSIAQGAVSTSGDSAVYSDDVFNTHMHIGTKSNNTDIINGVDLSGEGGLVWAKQRNNTRSHYLFDTENVGYSISSDLQDGKLDTSNRITSFNTNGFTLGTDNDVNQLDEEYVFWTFRKCPGFFDVVKYTGSSGIQNVPHELGSSPGMILIKCISDNGTNWSMWHRSGNYNYQQRLVLNNNNQTQSGEEWWGDASTPPDMNSTTFSVGGSDQVNGLGRTYIAYVFAHDDGSFGENGNESIIKCGSYVGDGGSHFEDLGFEPQWLLIKSPNDINSNWVIVDTMRGMLGYGMSSDSVSLYANASSYEGNVSSGRVKITPRGFRFDGESNDNFNGTSNTYFYMAIRRPHKPADSGTSVFAALTYAGDSVPNKMLNSSFTPDLSMGIPLDGGQVEDRRRFDSRLTSLESSDYDYSFLQTINSNRTNTDTNYTDLSFQYRSQGIRITTSAWAGYNYPSTNFVTYLFKRSPGFMDEVTYVGNSGPTRQIPHSLAAVPELIIIKKLTNTGVWLTWHKSYTLNDGEYILFNGSGAIANSNPPIFTSSAPTSTDFNVSYDGGRSTDYDPNITSEDYVAYLFASQSGVSKIGTYTGTGNNVDVDCGFTAGARFIMIKRSDTSGGSWYVWDSSRGIGTGNDPYIFINALSQSNADYIGSLNSGFTVKTNTPDTLNEDGGTYIFLAIA